MKISKDNRFEKEVNRTAISPDLLDLLTPIDYFFLWRYIKSKVYYENICYLNSAIISTFQELSDGMVTSIIWRTSVNNWKWSFRIREGILKNKIVMCLCVVYIKILMLSIHVEPN